MQIEYLGTGAAEGIPAIFCNCDFCKEARAAGAVRSRAQVLIDGELSVDFPPDAFYHMVQSRVDLSAIRYLLVSHSHMDHFYAHDFVLRGYKYSLGMTAQKLEIYGNAETLEVFRESVAREMKPVVAENYALHEIRAFEKACFGGYTVHPLKAQHSSKDPLVFLIEKGNKRILHLYDTGRLPEEDFEYLEAVGGDPVDLVTLDCTFLYGQTAAGARHMGLDENACLLQRLSELGLTDGHTQRVITHFSHNGTPTEALLRRAEREYNVIAAYDGMTVTV